MEPSIDNSVITCLPKTIFWYDVSQKTGIMMSGEVRYKSDKSANDSGFKRFAFEHGVTWFPEHPVDLDAVQETDKTQIYNLASA